MTFKFHHFVLVYLLVLQNPLLIAQEVVTFLHMANRNDLIDTKINIHFSDNILYLAKKQNLPVAETGSVDSATNCVEGGHWDGTECGIYSIAVANYQQSSTNYQLC